jgi:hypothetical protein
MRERANNFRPPGLDWLAFSRSAGAMGYVRAPRRGSAQYEAANWDEVDGLRYTYRLRLEIPMPNNIHTNQSFHAE